MVLQLSDESEEKKMLDTVDEYVTKPSWSERMLLLSTATSYIDMNKHFHCRLCDRATFVGQVFSLTALRCCVTFMMAHTVAALTLVALPL
jgi:hypothetical protein